MFFNCCAPRSMIFGGGLPVAILVTFFADLLGGCGDDHAAFFATFLAGAGAVTLLTFFALALLMGLLALVLAEAPVVVRICPVTRQNPPTVSTGPSTR